MINIEPNIKLGSNLLLIIGAIFVVNETLRYLLLHEAGFENQKLFWLWLLSHKLMMFSYFAFFPASRLMGRYNEKFGISFLMVAALAFIVGAGGYIVKWLIPAYALNDILRAAVAQFYLGITLLGVLGRLGSLEYKESSTDGKN